ncbi:unnamed protein product [Symbiodinium natans]|uniref:Uncharacterized protein n=1 Tax=Symbiodinium natans TaxID=878477 RepID=A0A812NPP4_9DINO|nr:unnamed protein product [Symbiodinium natans]
MDEAHMVEGPCGFILLTEVASVAPTNKRPSCNPFLLCERSNEEYPSPCNRGECEPDGHPPCFLILGLGLWRQSPSADLTENLQGSKGMPSSRCPEVCPASLPK